MKDFDIRIFTIAVTQYISILSSILIKGICKNNLKIKNQWKNIYIYIYVLQLEKENSKLLFMKVGLSLF